VFDLIIFSKDRAAQLDLLLASLDKNSNGLIDETNALLRASHDSFAEGYKTVTKRKYQDRNFWPWWQYDTTDFKMFTLSMIESGKQDFVAFAVDDNILYRKLEFTSDQLKALFARKSLMCLSLRLGGNCIIQDIYTGTPAVFPQQEIDYQRPFYIWDYRTAPPDQNFGYPLSLDFHIFRKSELLEWVRKTEFKCPNTLEAHLQQRLRETVPTEMASLLQSAVVNSPSNRVQDVFQNNAGKFCPASAESLNTEFLKGRRLNLDAIDFSQITSCHFELELPFKDADNG
jgi:hypothetical protein